MFLWKKKYQHGTEQSTSMATLTLFINYSYLKLSKAYLYHLHHPLYLKHHPLYLKKTFSLLNFKVKLVLASKHWIYVCNITQFVLKWHRGSTYYQILHQGHKECPRLLPSYFLKLSCKQLRHIHNGESFILNDKLPNIAILSNTQ